MLKACLGGERLLCLAEKGCWQIKNTRGRSTQKGKQFFAPPRAEKGSTVNPEYRIQPKADQHFPRFCHIPDTSGLSPPFARRRKIGQQPFRAGSQTTYLVFLIIWLCGPAWLHTDASSFWVSLAASNALMALAASPCALPPLSYMVSDAHRSPVSILFLSGLLAGCSADVHPCGAT